MRIRRADGTVATQQFTLPEEELPVPEWHRLEVEGRLAAADADPAAGIPWEEVKRRLQEK